MKLLKHKKLDKIIFQELEHSIAQGTININF